MHERAVQQEQNSMATVDSAAGFAICCTLYRSDKAGRFPVVRSLRQGMQDEN